MANWDSIEARIKSRPIRLHFAGWESDTLRLQQAGWQLAAEQDFMTNSIRLAIQHRELQMKAVSSKVPYDYLANSRNIPQSLIIPIDYMAARLDFHIQEFELPKFSPVDAIPQLDQTQITSLEDLAHFAPPLVRTQELIIPDESVADLMEKILSRQQPDRLKWAEQQMREQTRPRQKFHAQIISLVA